MVDATLEGGTLPPTKLGNTLYSAYLLLIVSRVMRRDGTAA